MRNKGDRDEALKKVRKKIEKDDVESKIPPLRERDQYRRHRRNNGSDVGNKCQKLRQHTERNGHWRSEDEQSDRGNDADNRHCDQLAKKPPSQRRAQRGNKPRHSGALHRSEQAEERLRIQLRLRREVQTKERNQHN